MLTIEVESVRPFYEGLIQSGFTVEAELTDNTCFPRTSEVNFRESDEN